MNLASPLRPRGPAAHAPRRGSWRGGWPFGVAAGFLLFTGLCQGDTLLVTTTADSGAGSLRAVIAAAREFDTIGFDPDLNGKTIVLTSGPLVVRGDALTIVGPGADLLAISGGKKSRVFEILPTDAWSRAPVSITGLTISDGMTGAKVAGRIQDGDDGGGIYNRGELRLEACRLTGNRTGAGGSDFSSLPPAGDGGRGGAVFNAGSLVLVNCQLLDNATGVGGDAFPFGAGNGGAGGAIFNDSSATLRLEGCIVSLNRTGDGQHPSGNGGDGGGICSTGANLVTLTASTLSGNATGDGAVGGDYQVGSGAPGGRGGSGAALFASGPVRLENCTVVDNHTGNGGDGSGAVREEAGYNAGTGGSGGGLFAASDLELVNCTLSGNRTGAGGKGGSGGSLPVPPYIQNSGGAGGAGGNGGAILAASRVLIRNSTVVSNEVAVGGAGGGGLPVGPAGSPGLGGGLAVTGAGAVTVVNTILAANQAPGTAPDVSGNVTSLGHNLVGIADGSTGFGAAGDLSGTATSPLSPGIGPLADNGGPTLTHALLTGSPAIDAGDGTDSASLPYDQRGPGFARQAGPRPDIGAFELLSPVVRVTSIGDNGPGTLRNSLASVALGGTITFDPSLNGQTIVLTNGHLVVHKDLEIIGPGADLLAVSGGNKSRVFEILPGARVTIRGLTIRDGLTAKGDSQGPDPAPVGGRGQDGGGILNRGVLTVDSCELTANRTGAGGDNLGGGQGGHGGAVFNGGVLILTDCRVVGNTTGVGGEGFVLQGSGGQGGSGGGIFNDTSAELRVDRCFISANATGSGGSPGGAGGDGGGVCSVGTKLVVLTASSLVGNATGKGTDGVNLGHQPPLITPGGSGGHGAAVFARGPVRFEGCAIVENSTGAGSYGEPAGIGGGGGGVSGSADIEIVNCTFSGNRAGAGGHGGAILAASHVRLRSSTVISNTVESGGLGGGLALTGAGAVTVVNTILAANQAPGTAPDVSGNVTSLGRNLVGIADGSTGFGAAGDLVGTANAPLAPGVGPLADNGGPALTHALLTGSPAINAGITGQPNAWQIADGSTGAGSGVLFYTNTLTAAQKLAATNNGWRFTVISRLVAGSGGTGPAHFITYGHGDRRFVVGWDVNASGQLTAQLYGAGGITTPLTAEGQATSDYHRHELVYNPSTGQATYLFDGATIHAWAGQSPDANYTGQAFWGSAASSGQGRMNYHQVQFAINGQGAVSAYDAGLEGSPVLGPDPISQGWTLTQSNPDNAAVSQLPISPDTVALPASVLDGLGLLYDQRGPGFPRLVGGRMDIGAYELQPPSALPQFVGLELAPDGVRLHVQGGQNETLRLEWNSQLVAGGWQPLANLATDDTGNLVYTDADARTTGQRFYRLVRP